MSCFITVMGVAGCGKSSLGQIVATQLGLPLVEGDDFHSPQSQIKMRSGVALEDADRQSWLESLSYQFAVHPNGLVLCCSALKLAYRARLRRACPTLCFVYLDIDPALAKERVSKRQGHHFFPVELVMSQFETLEPPARERGVLALNASDPLESLASKVTVWIRACPMIASDLGEQAYQSPNE